MGHHPNHPKHTQHDHEHGEPSKRRPLHRDWRVWTGVVLMLAAMGIYLMSLDEALQPSGPPVKSMPAAP